ncbi:MAG TPA: DNA cytosine methyltransferase [Gaiellaceae bacterium]|nr:DNA cytosine methyltransferase [Gaiellaceae bacterium]
MGLTSIEICAGAGGQAIGLEWAGFEHVALVELEGWACETLRTNRPEWNVIEGDLKDFNADAYEGVDLVAGGVPCPPFSKAGKQLGRRDERDLFPEALRIVSECMPAAVMLENVRGLLDPVFDRYRAGLGRELRKLGYAVDWKLLNASDFGVPQLRPRTLLVAFREGAEHFRWPEPAAAGAPTVGNALHAQMASGGWAGAAEWARMANRIAPTLVGGSKKHGGPDLGPTRARKAWADLGVDGLGLADAPPGPGFEGMPKLTVEMAATIQGFPPEWQIAGRKTAAYRQVGNAFPPPVAHAVGERIALAVETARDLAAAAA